jgi:hypothetical protein
MLARLAVRAISLGGSTRLLRTGMPCVAALALLAPAAALAQVLPKTPPDLGTAEVLPPGPTVTDWQPRGRAAVGTKIVITGPAFTPSAVEATIGGGHIPLPVRLATSTATRIELDVPASALGQVGALAIGHRGTRGTVLEAAYLIDALKPAIETPPAITTPPFKSLSVSLRVSEFPGATLNNDQVTVGGTCQFVKSSTTLSSDLQILIRGGALDVSCTFRTAQLTLGDGVRLVETRWVSNKVGDRCAKAGTISSTLPSASFQLTPGAVVVNPDANQAVRDFFVFGDGALVADGVTLTTVQRATSVLLPMIVDLKCVSMAIPLQTSAGTSPPTTSPQSFGVIWSASCSRGRRGSR